MSGVNARTVNGQKNSFGSFQTRADGISIRKMLEEQGVTSEEVIRTHLSFIAETMKTNPNLDLTRYRVNENRPNSEIPIMG